MVSCTLGGKCCCSKLQLINDKAHACEREREREREKGEGAAILDPIGSTVTTRRGSFVVIAVSSATFQTRPESRPLTFSSGIKSNLTNYSISF